MTSYSIDVIGASHIATVHSFKEMVQALDDGGCVKRMTISTLCTIVDCLERGDSYTGQMSDDSRWTFVIRKRASI